MNSVNSALSSSGSTATECAGDSDDDAAFNEWNARHGGSGLRAAVHSADEDANSEPPMGDAVDEALSRLDPRAADINLSFVPLGDDGALRLAALLHAAAAAASADANASATASSSTARPLLRSLRLEGCMIGSAGIVALTSSSSCHAPFLAWSSALRIVDLDNNDCDDEACEVIALEWMRAPPRLAPPVESASASALNSTLSLISSSARAVLPRDYDGIDDDDTRISVEPRGLHVLRLSSNEAIGDAGAAALARALASDAAPLRELRLGACSIGDEGVCALARAMRLAADARHSDSVRGDGGGGALQCLDLHANFGIGDAGVVALARALWPQDQTPVDLDSSAAQSSLSATATPASATADAASTTGDCAISTPLLVPLALTELDLRACSRVTAVGARALALAIDAHNQAVASAVDAGGNTGPRRDMLVYRGPGSELLKYSTLSSKQSADAAAMSNFSHDDDGDDDDDERLTQSDSDCEHGARDSMQADTQRASFEAMIASENARCGGASIASGIDKAELQYAQLLAVAAAAAAEEAGGTGEYDEVDGGGSDDEK